MHTLPFSSVDEAKANGADLRESLYFYSIRFPASECPIGLQQSYELMSRALGCNSWADLAARLRGKHFTEYYSSQVRDLTPSAHNALALRMTQLIGAAGDEFVVATVKQALVRSAFGCAPEVREFMQAAKLCKGYTAGHAQELHQVDIWWDYQRRYYYLRNAYQERLLHYERDKAYAKILGLKPPKRPMPRRGETG